MSEKQAEKDVVWLRAMLEQAEKNKPEEPLSFSDLLKLLEKIREARKAQSSDTIEVVFPNRKSAEDFNRWMADEREFFKDVGIEVSPPSKE